MEREREYRGGWNSGWRWLAGLILILGLGALPSAAWGQAEELVLANLHAVSAEEDFVGVDVSFFALPGLAEREGIALVEAFMAIEDDGLWQLQARGSWSLAFHAQDIIPAGSEGFFEPRYPMVREDLEIVSPEPYGPGLLLILVRLDAREIREERLFPNVRAVPGEIDASLADLGQGELVPGLLLDQLMEVLEPGGGDPQNAGATLETGEAAWQPDLESLAAPVKNGTHIQIHAHPQMPVP